MLYIFLSVRVNFKIVGVEEREDGKERDIKSQIKNHFKETDKDFLDDETLSKLLYFDGKNIIQSPSTINTPEFHNYVESLIKNSYKGFFYV